MTQEVDFLAVDEIQLAAHPRRGHVFTDRLLHARGRVETWFLGADTMRPLILALIPTASIQSQPRLSTLAARGQSRLEALPVQTALVAFSVPEVYRLAERLRQRKGGAAVVLGALSPRARNAQVALYEAKEVDYLVATDAIGMGLNLGIRHVAFAGLRKFDGRDERFLLPAELAQIAGRAGRHLQNGTFGTLAPLPALNDGLKRCIEEHRFESVQQLTWRNSDLCLDSIAALLESLRLQPPRKYFKRLAQATDLDALERVETDSEVRRRARGSAAVQLLWQACQIPDYRQRVPELHAELVKQIFLQLSGPSGGIDPDWLAASIKPLDDVSGDIDALTSRIASVRTWTYISNHGTWLPNVEHFTERTRDLEDRLSDALHDRLVERFVARRRHSVDLRVRRPCAAEAGRLEANGDSPFRALEKLREQLFETSQGPSIERWVEDLVAAPHQRFRVDEAGQVFDRERCLGHLAAGTSLLRPEFKLTLTGLSSGQQLRLSRRLLAWSRDLVEDIVGPLRHAPDPPWSPAARGLLYQLEQNLGSMPGQPAAQQRSALLPSDRESLAQLGIRVRREVIYSAQSLQPAQRLARLALCRTFTPRAVVGLPGLMSRASFQMPKELDTEWLTQVGFVVLGGRAIRVDVADRVCTELWQRAGKGPFELPDKLARWLGCGLEQLPPLARALGYRCGDDGFYRCRHRPRKSRRKRPARSA